MLDMVATFVFDASMENVLLIRKNKPEWQRGMINGIGGKIERGETPRPAAERELYEEACVGVCQNDLEEFCVISGPGWRVHFFRAFADGDLRFEQKTEEEVLLVRVADVGSDKLRREGGATWEAPVIWNLNWLIPMALDRDLITPVMVYDATKYEGAKKVRVWDA